MRRQRGRRSLQPGAYAAIAVLLLVGMPATGTPQGRERDVAWWRSLSKAEFYREYAAVQAAASPLADLQQLGPVATPPPHAEYVPPSFALDADNDGRVTSADADVVRALGRFGLTHTSYDARADVLANAFAADASGYPIASVPDSAIQQAVAAITQGPVHEMPRPRIGAAFYAWYENAAGVPLPESWVPTISKPLPGLYNLLVPYDSTAVVEMQSDLAHAAGIDFFFVSDFQRHRFFGPIEELARRDPGKYAFVFLYEHLQRLPVKIVNGAPQHDFDDAAVRSAFVAQMDEYLEIIRRFGPDNYVTLHGYYPVWAWAASAFAGDVAGTIEAFNASRDMKIALLASEITLFPPRGGFSAAQHERLRAYLGLMPYGYYTPLHTVTIAKGELNEVYTGAIASSAAIWWKKTRTISNVYGVPLEMGVSVQFQFADKQGNPPLRSSTEQRRYFIEQLHAQAVTAINPPLINVTSWNEWGENHQIEPSVADGFLNAGLLKRHFGPSHYYRSNPGRVGPIVLSRPVSGAAAGEGEGSPARGGRLGRSRR